MRVVWKPRKDLIRHTTSMSNKFRSIDHYHSARFGEAFSLRCRSIRITDWVSRNGI